MIGVSSNEFINNKIIWINYYLNNLLIRELKLKTFEIASIQSKITEWWIIQNYPIIKILESPELGIANINKKNKTNR